ncbi:hypothetical protein [Aquitalea sp. USM4]|uniref:hypothetical protein n=1 Tax=Aquitalea sp. USM4 TaxID=1590041 RepID=UPI001038781B|nr:hypothetical protein [Aquitalea sp. USM4]QBJ79944.1 hypothetical protein DKK66_18860 [Aquitalea sp. USM4]
MMLCGIKIFLAGLAFYLLVNDVPAFAAAPDSATIIAPVADGNPSTLPEGKARIRFFGQNGIDLSFYRNRTCYQDGLFGLKGGESVSGGFGSGLASLLGTVGSIGIGMPETNSSMHLHDKDLIGSKAFYREYEFTADEPLTVAARWGGCRTQALTFKPEANKDYEFEMTEQNGLCELIASRLMGTSSPATLQPLRDYTKASECP